MDTQAPAIQATINGRSANMMQAGDRISRNLEVQGSANDQSTSSVVLDLVRQDQAGAQSVSRLQSDSNEFHFSLPDLAKGTYDLTLTATDQMGNTSQMTAGIAGRRFQP